MIVLLTTWPNHPKRVEYFKRTVDALQSRLSATATFVASAESQKTEDAPWSGDALELACEARRVTLIWRPETAHLPSHLNQAFKWAFSQSDTLFYVQDDWELHRNLDLSFANELLNRDETLAGIRFWSATKYFRPYAGFVEIDKCASWSYGDNPALWHRRWFQQCGPFDTHGDFGTHEHRMRETLEASRLSILAAKELKESSDYYFRHLGAVTSVPGDQRWADAPKRTDEKLWS